MDRYINFFKKTCAFIGSKSHAIYDNTTHTTYKDLKMNKSLILSLILLTLSMPSLAQKAPIDEMFRVMSIERQMIADFEATLPLIDQMTDQFELDAKGYDELREIFRVWFNEDIDHKKMINEFKKLYLQTFTDDEIREITHFYQTPVGKKFIEKSTELMKLSAQISMQESQSKQAQLMERIDNFLEKRGIKQ